MLKVSKLTKIMFSDTIPAFVRVSRVNLMS